MFHLSGAYAHGNADRRYLSIRNNYQRSHLMFADIPIAATWQKVE